MTTTATAPQYLPADTYTGRHSLRSNKVRSDVFTAAELAAMTSGDTPIVLWEYHGTVRGVNLYGRHRFVAQTDGSLVGYNSQGGCTIIHPADRRIRVMTK